jgi:hypothetical protein
MTSNNTHTNVDDNDTIFNDDYSLYNILPDVTDVPDHLFEDSKNFPRYIHQRVDINTLNTIFYNEITHDNLKNVLFLLYKRWTILRSTLNSDNYNIVMPHMNAISKVYNQIIEPFKSSNISHSPDSHNIYHSHNFNSPVNKSNKSPMNISNNSPSKTITKKSFKSPVKKF